MAFAETANLAIKLSVGGNWKTQLNSASRSLKKLDKDASRAYKAGAQIGTGIKRGAILAVGGATILATALGKSVDAAGDFEAQLNTINTIAFKNADGLKEIGKGIRDVAKRTGLGLDDLTASYYDLLSAGIRVGDAQAVLNDAVTLGIGGLATTTETVDLLTTAYNAYGLNAAGAARATDQFAQAVADGKVKASEIAGTFSDIAPLAKAYKVGIDQIAASYGFLTAKGQTAGDVATGMNRAIVSLIKPSKSLLKAQKVLGVNFTTLVQKKGLVPALEVLRKYSDKTKIPLIELLGRIEAVKYTLNTTGPNFTAFNKELLSIRDSSGEAAKQMAARQQGLNYQLAVLKARVKDAGLTIGTALLPKLTPVVSALNDFLSQNEGKISDFGAQLAAGLTPEGVISGIKGITSALIPMIDLVKVAAEPVKAIVNAFLALPREVQTVLVGAFAVNKLTGGLVTNAAGGIIEAIGKGLLGGIKAPLVNVQGGVVNVGGGIPGAGGVGGAAAAAGGLSTAAAVGVAAPVLGLGLIAAVNSPLWVKSGALNDALQSKGLTQAERAAQQYYTASARDQAEMRKHIAILPTIADFNSGNAKLATNISQQVASATKDKDSDPVPSKLQALHVKAQQTAAAVKDADSSIVAKGNATVSAERSGSGAIVAAVRSIPAPVTNVTTNVSLTAGGLTKTVTVTKRYGPVGGSRVVDDGVRER